MGSKLRTAVVGVGYLGRFHAQKHKTLGTLSYVCDASAERAQEIAKEMGCEGVTDPKSLIGKIDAVTIAADTRSHFEVAKIFLSNGIHVLIEKPICATVAEAEAIVELSEKNNLKLAVGHVERFNPAFAAGIKQVKTPTYVQLKRLAPFKPRSLAVDVVLDLMIHDLDLAATLVQSPIKKIRAKGAKVITEFNDACDAWLEFENGTEAFISCSRIDQKTVRTIDVFDSQGILQMDLGGQTANRLKKVNAPAATPLEVVTIAVDKWDALQKETESFFDSVEHNKEVLVTGRQGLEALKAAEKILELCK
jgi:predicted dehydrogenase